MWTLTGFADEISQDLTEQIALLNELGVRHIEFRSAWNTKVLDLTDEQLERAKAMLDEAGIERLVISTYQSVSGTGKLRLFNSRGRAVMKCSVSLLSVGTNR